MASAAPAAPVANHAGVAEAPGGTVGAKATPTEAPVTAPPASPAKGGPEKENLIKLGISLTDRGDYRAAEIAFYQVLKAPRTPESEIKAALLALARMHRKQGTLTKAVAIYERFLKDFPLDERSPDALLDLGRSLRALGIHKPAIARFYSVLNSTLKISGGNFEHYQLLAKTAQFEIAQTHFEAGEFAEAHKYFTRLRLLELAPADRARAHFMAASAQRLQGDLEGAVTNLRSFLDQAPADENIPEARYLLAVTLRDLKRPQEALQATLELLRAEKGRTHQDPKRWAYWQRRTGNQLANDFFEGGDTFNAQLIYAGLVELAPEPAWRLPLQYQIALCYERLGAVERARQSYRDIVGAVGSPPAPEFAELGRLATWRIEHLNWRDRIDQQVSSHFTVPGDKSSPTSPTPAGPTSAPTPTSAPAAPPSPSGSPTTP
ncbi:MAG: tetratricopeptide repeat protein [Verrucomicrobia bacterium]|nr:tetratricopeptide repeat protein [Verrucomicrobiota bacterium]